MKEIIKDYQLLIGLIIIALVIYQFSGSDFSQCIDGYMSAGYEYSKGEATEECMEMMY